jgi:hypothetical protein
MIIACFVCWFVLVQDSIAETGGSAMESRNEKS